MTKFDLDEARIDTEECCYCSQERAWIDRYGLPWCDEHQHRGSLLNHGVRLHWPAIQCFPYAIGQGDECWHSAATTGSDELVYMALAAIEHMKNSQTTECIVHDLSFMADIARNNRVRYKQWLEQYEAAS